MRSPEQQRIFVGLSTLPLFGITLLPFRDRRNGGIAQSVGQCGARRAINLEFARSRCQRILFRVSIECFPGNAGKAVVFLAGNLEHTLFFEFGNRHEALLRCTLNTKLVDIVLCDGEQRRICHGVRIGHVHSTGERRIRTLGVSHGVDGLRIDIEALRELLSDVTLGLRLVQGFHNLIGPVHGVGIVHPCEVALFPPRHNRQNYVAILARRVKERVCTPHEIDLTERLNSSVHVRKRIERVLVAASIDDMNVELMLAARPRIATIFAVEDRLPTLGIVDLFPCGGVFHLAPQWNRAQRFRSKRVCGVLLEAIRRVARHAIRRKRHAFVQTNP